MLNLLFMWVHMPKIFKWFNVNLYIYNNLTENEKICCSGCYGCGSIIKLRCIKMILPRSLNLLSSFFISYVELFKYYIFLNTREIIKVKNMYLLLELILL